MFDSKTLISEKLDNTIGQGINPDLMADFMYMIEDHYQELLDNELSKEI